MATPGGPRYDYPLVYEPKGTSFRGKPHCNGFSRLGEYKDKHDERTAHESAIAASTGRHSTVEAILAAGADVHRGNFNGETALMRACLATHCFDTQTFHTLVAALSASIRTLDTARRSVFHHIVATAGVKGRAVGARYYLDQVNLWIVNHERADFRSIIDIQDEHGDTALNIAARVGNRSLVRVLLDAGANKLLANKLGLRPGDFGVETEVGGFSFSYGLQGFRVLVGTWRQCKVRRYSLIVTLRPVSANTKKPRCHSW